VPVIPDRLGFKLKGDEVETLRTSAFSVGLEVDPAVRSQLPKVSKGTIENYLGSHRLLIQAEVAFRADHDPQFTGNIQAAFYALSSPRVTARPEAMIEEAVGKFRLLGMLEEKTPGTARTLVLAFHYTSDASPLSTGVTGEQLTFDLLILHLQPGHGPGRPEVSVFATAQGRSLFQEIEVAGDPLKESRPAVLAEIRFNRFEMLGVYPADPVVTSIRNRARYTLPLPAIRSKLENSEDFAQSFAALLEELHAHPDPTSLFPKALPVAR
jgi:hypothetical protein